MVSTCPLIFKFSSLCINPWVIVPSVLITIGFTFTFMFHIFFQLPSKVLPSHFSFRFLSVLPFGQPERQSPLFGRFSFFEDYLVGLAEIRWSVCSSKSLRIIIIIIIIIIITRHWRDGSSVRQCLGRPGFNPRSSYTKNKKKNWYLIPPCLTLSIIRYGSRVKWCNPGKGVAPSPTPWRRSYRKDSLRVTLDYGHQLYYLRLLLSFFHHNVDTRGTLEDLTGGVNGKWESECSVLSAQLDDYYYSLQEFAEAVTSGFHWSLSNSKSPQISVTHLRILTDF